MYFLTSLSPLSKRRCRTLELWSLRFWGGDLQCFQAGVRGEEKEIRESIIGQQGYTFQKCTAS